MTPVELGFFGGGFAPVAADDSFLEEKISPGRYHVAINGYTAFVKSIRASDTETEGDILDVRNGPPGPVTVTLSSNFAEISGTVSDSQGAAANTGVVLKSVDNPRWERDQTTESDGAYRFSNLAPGKYKLIAVDAAALDGGIGALNEDDYDDVAVTLDVSAGDKIVKDLKRHNP
jgi:hypothetical protein